MSDRVLQTVIYVVFITMIVASGVLAVLIVKPGSEVQACITAVLGCIAFLVFYTVVLQVLTRRRA